MEKDLKENIADSLEIDKILIPHLPYLLQDLWALGSSPSKYSRICKKLNLDKNSRVLDLGCGKGAVSIAIAKEYDCNVKGVDAMHEFIEDARVHAKKNKVGKLCEFEVGDLNTALQFEREYDLTIFASLGPILGNFDDKIEKLRKTVNVGGHILIDDGYLKDSVQTGKSGYEHYADRETTIKLLSKFGDTIITEVIYTDEETNKINYEFLHLIEKRGNELKTGSPELLHSINNYLKRQKEECEFIDEKITGAIWLIRKNSD
ncbi:MAG: methyltransferase domain-containing protein [Melioribacteraceae bacterium]|nr:methyltransferase domain-containing protein [Melioribacteraceae bacterium]MCF8355391.1 methyltransferase domain-containing protein [Melioribacteraceae bacterium]MCF8394636.1 methyltransferase domain-containing protein [Melioribacteraceae bacterium]MCF8419633.1 methyltransferase domain-containing protein [Melioribacteraceae bacterium]